MPIEFWETKRIDAFRSLVAFSDVSTRKTFQVGSYPETWGEAAIIRTISQQEKFNVSNFPLHGTFEPPRITFGSNAYDWHAYINHLERKYNGPR